MNTARACVISGFRREVAGNCALLGYYAAISGNFLPTFGTTYRSHQSFKNGTDRLSRNVGKKLPLLGALWT